MARQSFPEHLPSLLRSYFQACPLFDSNAFHRFGHSCVDDDYISQQPSLFPRMHLSSSQWAARRREVHLTWPGHETMKPS